MDGGGGRWALGGMVGRSAAMERLFLQMRYLANHLRIALLEGERGTGKQLAARTLHQLSPHQGGPFLHCPAAAFFSGSSLPTSLEKVRGGTLYLSGVDALNHEQQGRMLHLLGWLAQANARPLGLSGPTAFTPGSYPALRPTQGAVLPLTPLSKDEEAPRPRALLVSSERPLRSLVLYGKFRGDLQAQLGAVHMQLPPLRDHQEDIPLLLEHFLKRFHLDKEYLDKHGKRLRGYAPDLVPALLMRRWDGNVRELEQTLAAAALRTEGEWLRARDLPSVGTPAASSAPTRAAFPSMIWAARPGEGPRLQSACTAPRQTGNENLPRRSSHASAPVSTPDANTESDLEPTLDPNLDRAIMRHIRRVLGSVNGNKLRAARLLGISRSTLYRLLDANGSDSEPRTGIAV